jgi:hypothetical protein
VHNVDQASQDIELRTHTLREFIIAVRDEVAPCFEQAPDYRADLINASETALVAVQELQGLSVALIASLRFSLRNVSNVARDAVMFHEQQINMQVQNKFGIDNELAQIVIDWFTGTAELPEGVYDTKAVNAVLWLISDTQEALEGLVYDDDSYEEFTLKDAS